LILKPDSVFLHQSLAQVYWHVGYFDLTLEHLREAVRLRKLQGQLPVRQRSSSRSSSPVWKQGSKS